MKEPLHSQLVGSTNATLLGFLSCLIWSSAVLVISFLSASFPPLLAGSCELVIAGTFLFLVAAVQGKIRSVFQHPLKYLVLGGAFWGANFLFAWLAIGASKNQYELVLVGLLNYLWPIFTLLLSIPFLKKLPNRLLLPGVTLAFLGIVTAKMSVVAPSVAELKVSEEFNWVAYSFAVIDALAWALYSNLARLWSNPKSASPVPLFMWCVGIPTLFFSIRTGVPAMPGAQFSAFLVGWSCLSSLAYISWDIGMRRGNVVAVAAASMLIPFFSTVITAAGSKVEHFGVLLLCAFFVVGGSYLAGKGVTDPLPKKSPDNP